ncbi:glycosyltransferase [Adhaeribacter aquaticus]|uniref:glycosyltransferase n=1 Tax=Adhaeribacter aquaticus TaxID=299567 RepID=UPI00042686BF|nr:glycosyltransferase [Adhaeribacter aquaticus]
MIKYRLLHIIDSVERGGAETLLVNTIETIKKKYPNCEQYLVTLYRGGTLLPKVAPFVKYYNLGLNKYNIITVYFKLRRLLKNLQVDVVHSHLLHSTLISRIALPKKTRLVSTYHSVFYDPSLVDYAKKELIFDKLTYKPKYFSIFVSDAVQNNIRKAVGINNNYKTLVNFASPAFCPKYKFKQESCLKVIMVGNLNPVKNHKIAIQALHSLVDKPISIDIYGEGILRIELENLINQTGSKVVLKGGQAMSSELLAQYDLFLMTSHHEGMPISLLEAMQTGLPALLNDLPMLRETAGDSALYYKYDDLDDLINNLVNIQEGKLILNRLSENALTRAKTYSAESYLNQLFKIYYKS